MVIRRFAFITLLVVVLVLTGCNRSGERGLNPGDLPPQFTLNTLSGSPVNLADFRGKAVLLNFWASWCGPCRDEMPALESLYGSLKDKGFVVLAVAVEDDLSTVIKFKDELNLTFPILLDVDGKVRDRYKVKGFPESFILDKEGKMILFPDPESSLTLRIVGPRDWSGAGVLKQFRALL